jgi:hypothetical protein
MQETFPHIISKLPDGSRGEVMISLEEMQIDPALADLQPALERLHSLVTVALPKPSAP